MIKPNVLSKFLWISYLYQHWQFHGRRLGVYPLLLSRKNFPIYLKEGRKSWGWSARPLTRFNCSAFYTIAFNHAFFTKGVVAKRCCPMKSPNLWWLVPLLCTHEETPRKKSLSTEMCVCLFYFIESSIKELSKDGQICMKKRNVIAHKTPLKYNINYFKKDKH